MPAEHFQPDTSKGFTRYKSAGKPPEVSHSVPNNTIPYHCELCGGPAEDEPLNEIAMRVGGFHACKACIDASLAMLFGPDAEAVQLAHNILNLAARRQQ
jgi:hypothetical protein